MNATTLVNFENNYFSANVDKFPFVYVVFTGEGATDEEFVEYMKFLDTLYTQEDKFVMLTDYRKGSYMKSKHRVDFGNWTKQNKERIQKQFKGAVFIMSSFLQKSILQAVFAIQTPPYEYLVVDNQEKAEIWLKEQLEK